MSTQVFGDKTDLLAYIGAAAVSLAVFKFVWSCVRAFMTYGVGKIYPIRDQLRSAGGWAVVTGATDGIGKAYCEELARYGLDIVLISRTESKLKAVASDIESQFKVKTKIITADFSKGYSIYADIKTKLQGLSIGVLVNNVGLSYDYPEYFLELQDQDKLFANLLYVNCTSVTQMSAIVMPGMVQRKKGMVINISSAAGLAPTPLLSVYSACKAYVTYLSQCLNIEYSRHGVTVQCVSPYFVCSNMSKIKRASLLIPSPTTYVRSALKTIPFQSVTNGYWPHALTHLLTTSLPFNLNVKLGMKMLMAANKRAKRKLEAKKE